MVSFIIPSYNNLRHLKNSYTSIKKHAPQTNFYFINVNKTDFLYDKEYVDETYNHVLTIPNYNGKVWEYIQGWSCENFLKKCVKRNNLKKHHLIPKEKYLSLLQLVKK
jgi:hypothetical protein